MDERLISDIVRNDKKSDACIIAVCFESLFYFNCHPKLNYLYNPDYFEICVHSSRLELLGSWTMAIFLTVGSMIKPCNASIFTG